MIDLFCGAGGTTTAVHESGTGIEVVACVNHDANAIRSHAANYPNCKHFTEDIRTLDLTELVGTVSLLRIEKPNCLIALWASLECTNYSRAKGGQPRDADSRSLAEHLFRYQEALDPDFIWIENVEEFMSWGPLDKSGRPVSKDRGRDYMRWIKKLKSLGYHHDSRILNSANYGGYTTRKRYFGQFSKDLDMISWPDATHYKALQNADLFDGQRMKWKAVREVLDLQDEGKSIFERKKPLSDNTLKRIYAGLVKFIAKGDESFLKTYYSGSGQVLSTDGPARTVTTIDHHAFVKCIFLSSYYGNSTLVGDDSPCGTVTTKDRFAKIEAHFLQHYYSGGGQHSSIENPHPAILAVPKSRLTEVKFIDNQYGNSKPQGLDVPSGTITINPKQAIVSAKPWLINMNSSTVPAKELDHPAPTITSARTHYLVNPQWGGNGWDIERPCFTLIARMDKAPSYIVSAETGGYGIVVFENDSEITIKIKMFMAAFGIIDIKMRMLKILELLKIQGFPENYVLMGTQTEQKKYIGNSVEVTVGKALFRSIYASINRRIAA